MFDDNTSAAHNTVALSRARAVLAGMALVALVFMVGTGAGWVAGVVTAIMANGAWRAFR